MIFRWCVSGVIQAGHFNGGRESLEESPIKLYSASKLRFVRRNRNRQKFRLRATAESKVLENKSNYPCPKAKRFSMIIFRLNSNSYLSFFTTKLPVKQRLLCVL